MYKKYIYQIYEKPTKRRDWIDEEFISDSPLLSAVSDLIDGIENRDAALENLGNWLHEHRLGAIDGEVFILFEDVDDSYFSKRYTAFQEAVRTLQNLSQEQFSRDYEEVHNQIAAVEKTTIDRYNTYIMFEWDFGRIMPMDQFLRNARCNTPYFVGGICYYLPMGRAKK